MSFDNINVNVIGPTKANNKHVGTTDKRPAFNNIRTGFQYFDTTLGKPIWYNGTEWVDATGNNPDIALEVTKNSNE